MSLKSGGVEISTLMVSSGKGVSSLFSVELSSSIIEAIDSDPTRPSTSSDLACGVTTSFVRGDTSWGDVGVVALPSSSLCFLMVMRGFGVVLYCHLPGDLFNLNLYRLVEAADCSTADGWTLGLKALLVLWLEGLFSGALERDCCCCLFLLDWKRLPELGAGVGSSLCTDIVVVFAGLRPCFVGDCEVGVYCLYLFTSIHVLVSYVEKKC